jgi:hypothetical protein
MGKCKSGRTAHLSLLHFLLNRVTFCGKNFLSIKMPCDRIGFGESTKESIKEELEKMATKTAKTAAQPARKNGHVYLTAIDIGFGESKGLSSLNNREVFPSTVEPGKPANSKVFKHNYIDREKLIVTTADGTFNVGKQAMLVNPLLVSSRTVTRDRASDPKFRVMFQTMVGLLLPEESGEYDVFVVTGLPNADYDKKIRENLEEFISGSFTVEFHIGNGKSITKKVNIVGKEIVRQPEGSVTYNHFEFTPEQFLVQSALYRRTTGIIDIGHLTTDYALFVDGVIVDSPNTNGSTVATTEMYKRLATKISRFVDAEFGLEYTPSDNDLDRAVREKVLYFNGADVSVADLVEEAAAEIASKIADAVLTAWGQQARTVEQIILAGGGAYVFADALRDEFENRKVQGFVVVDSAQFSNVIGFYMLGALALVDEDQSNVEEVYEQYVKPVFEAEAA